MLRYFRYSIPFSFPFRTSTGTISHREGIILSFETDGIVALGEVAPLPGYSNESLEQIIQVCLHNKKILNDAFYSGEAETIISLLDSIHQFPSLSFGLDTLNNDLRSKQTGLSFHEYLFKNPFQQVPCNFTVGLTNADDLIARVERAVSDGYQTIKFKAGNELNSELKIIKTVRKNFPEINIRIDVNQAWGKKEAIQNLNQFADLEIQYCEQPVPSSNLEDLREVKNQSLIPIAADEAARTIEDIHKLIEMNACNVLILKPMLFGRINNLIVTKELAFTHNIEVVFTTSFEGVIGRTATAILASGLGSQNLAHGLATGIYLKEGEAKDAEIHKGFYRVSEQAGLGNPVDLKYLEEIS